MKLTVYLVLVSISVFTYARDRYKWTEIDLPDKENKFQIIDISDNQIIWVNDLKFNIYKSHPGGWIKYPSPFPDSLEPFKIIKIDDGTFAAWAFDGAYRSHIRIFSSGKWSNRKYLVDVPVNDFLKNEEGGYFVYGNFGALFYLSNNILTPVKNPIKNHIQTAIKAEDGTVWLGTKYDGIFKFSEGNFTKVEFADKGNYEIMLIKEKDGKIYAYHDEYNILELRGNKFVKSRISAAELSGRINDKSIGIVSFSLLNRSEWMNITYPLYFKPSQIFLDGSSAVYLVSDDRLLKGTRHLNFYFYELGGSYLIDGADQNNSTQVFFNDINNDGYSDLIVHNTYPPGLVNLYVSNHDYPFMERTFSAEELIYYPNRIYKFSDLNNDYYDDLIVSFSDSIGSGINIYRNMKDLSFVFHKKYYSPEYLLKSAVKNLETVDIDNDGDLDINLSYYYGQEDQPGNDIFYYNKFNGQYFVVDTSYKEISKGWNLKSVFADIDNDGDLDWYRAIVWWKDKLLINNNGTYSDVSDSQLNDKYQNTQGAGFADIDNDGDLDLIRTGDEQLVSVSLNDGKGFFTDATDSLINRYAQLKLFSYGKNKSINVLDVNNDGYQDILLVTNFPKDNKTGLLLNNKGRGFNFYGDFNAASGGMFFHSACADVDSDGDLDLYLIKNGRNMLLINNLDDKNYIRIKLSGVSSNTGAKNTKIWLYLKSEGRRILAGYRETGVSCFSGGYANEDITHFGADAGGIYDLVIKFQSGKVIKLNDIKPPFFNTIYENGGLYKEAVVFSSLFFNLVMERDIQLYILIVLGTIFIIGIGIRYGHEKFNWGIKLSIGLIIINFSLFWVILLLAYSSDSDYLKFLLPLTAASLGVITPNLVFFNLRSNIIKRNISEYKDELLNQIINFSHGEWASKNINSLIFLLQSIPPDIETNDKYKKQLKERVTTFNSLTIISLDKISYILKQTEIDPETAERLIQTIKEIKSINLKMLKDDYNFTEREKNLFSYLKDLIKLLKNKVIAEYSCSPVDVVDQVLETKKFDLKADDIDIDFSYPAGISNTALIKPNELADIIDNSLANSAKALINTEEPKILIEIKWTAPKYRISISNNGEIIQKENWEIIFEKGFSVKGGSGFGLYNARKILSKYGGRIFVQSSDSEWTTFLIELNEGDAGETDHTDHR